MPKWLRIVGSILAALIAIGGLLQFGEYVVRGINWMQQVWPDLANHWPAVLNFALVASGIALGLYVNWPRKRGIPAAETREIEKVNSLISKPTRPAASESELAAQKICGRAVPIAQIPLSEPAEQCSIRGREFEDCELIGTAIIAPTGGTNFYDCTIGHPVGHDVSIVFWPVAKKRDVIVGPVGFVGCTFRRCRFTGVGFCGTRDLFKMIVQAMNRPTSG